MVVLSDHHWSDHERGLAELRRVARRVVLFTWDPAATSDSWLVSEYLPCFEELIPKGFRIQQTVDGLGGARVEPVLIPHDCLDGFLHAYWRRPDALPRSARARRHLGLCAHGPEVPGGGPGPAGRRPRVRAPGSAATPISWALEELDLGYRLLIHPP